MTVRVRFQVRRRATGRPAAASALLVQGRDAASVLAVCTRLGLDPSGRIHDIDSGFLVRLERPTSELVPGAVRLRELSADLFIPVDAELVPTLLEDEAAGLVRDGGLVFLPGGRILRFDRGNSVALSVLLDASARPRREWEPMPEPRALAGRIVEISREWSEPPSEDPYREWEDDVRNPGGGGRAARKQRRGGRGRGRGDTEGDAGLEDDEAGTGAGWMSGLSGLGETLRGWIVRAGSGARSLGEQAGWGMLDHSALVRKLLREFRQGDTNRALRHAFSMTPADPRGRTVGWGNRLPVSRAIYNLYDLLGGSPRGQPVGVWQARPDLMEELKREYRKAAERAIQQGDYRRAAYIYGKLLGDDRLAAQALQRGGLHHDAAILYLKKLNDRAAAAQAFEAAGEVDRATALYREIGRHESAGDLLRRLGDEAGARDEYVHAATAATTASPPDWYAGGRILLHKARLSEPAMQMFRIGWERRPAVHATACALELAMDHAVRGEIESMHRLLDEADAHFRSGGTARDVEAFYNQIALIATAAPDLAPFGEDVRDRARLALAGQLRRQVEAGSPAAPSVAALFGEPSLWNPAFVRDAHFAASAAAAAASRAHERAGKTGRHPRAPGIQVFHGAVTAVCQASATGEMIIGFAEGKILAFRPRRHQVVPVGDVSGPVTAIACDPDGQVVVALRHTESGSVLVPFVRRPDRFFRAGPDTPLPSISRTWLTPILPIGTHSLIGVGKDHELVVFEAMSGMPRASLSLAKAQEPPATAILLPHDESFRVLTHDGPRWVLLDNQGRQLGRTEPTSRPVGGARSPRCGVPLGWSSFGGLVKIVGVDQHGGVYASQFLMEDGVFELLSSPVATTEGGYIAAAETGPSKVVAVSASRIDWLSHHADRFQVVHTLPDPGLASTVACFPSTSPEEALVVSADGFVTRVEVPRRWKPQRAKT